MNNAAPENVIGKTKKTYMLKVHLKSEDSSLIVRENMYNAAGEGYTDTNGQDWGRRGHFKNLNACICAGAH